MQDLSLHILDLVDNCLRAEATRVTVEIREDRAGDKLYIDIVDNGRGMDRPTLERVLDPFFTTKAVKAVGLGLPLFAQAARESGGSLRLDSAPGRGTAVHAVFGLSHPDRRPLGDVEGTIQMLQAAHPEIELVYNHTTSGEEVAHETETRRS